jgi:truncated hemoglobin YjbI
MDSEAGIHAVRHLPYPICKAERDTWLACMGRALEQTQGRTDT